MSRMIVVLDALSELPAPPVPVRATAAFLSHDAPLEPGTLVVNLAADRSYMGSGWYVSLLAEARGGRPMPEAALLEQATDRRARDRALREEGLDVLDADEVAARQRDTAAGASPGGPPWVIDDPDDPKLRPPTDDEHRTVRLLLGRALGPDPARVARRAFAAWPLPLMEARLVRDAGRWRIYDLAPLALSALSADERGAAARSLAKMPPASSAAPSLPSLAVLWDPTDPSSASSAETLDRLARVGARMGLRVERVRPGDLDRLADHDALFIRTVTGVDQPAWRFATRAEALDMPVIDHPSAIVRCSNKVYLHELLRRAGLATPPTVIFGREADPAATFARLSERLGTPVVVKVPDGSFSTAVYRITEQADFVARIPPLLERSPLLVAQAYLPTTFDWRVGVLGGAVVWAARDHMVPGHW